MKKIFSFNFLNKTINYKYDIDGKIKQINNIKYSYDKLNRVTRKNIGSTYNIKYTYQNINDEKTTNLIKTLSNGDIKLTYTYDDNGNIETIKENDTLINEYEYDNLNQLTKEHDKKQNHNLYIR